MNTIIIDKLLIHKFDMEHSKVITSDKFIDLIEGTLEYYDKKIEKALTSPTKKEVVVGSQHQLFQYATKMLESEEAFKANATAISNDIFNLARQVEQMPDSNVLYVECKVDGVKHILVLKLNYKIFTTCLIEENNGLNEMKFVNRAMPPIKTSSVDEAFIINVNDNKLEIIEKRYIIDGKPGYYLNENYIKGEPKLSDKEKLSYVTKIVRKVDSQFNVFENDPAPFVKQEVASLVQERLPVKPLAVAKKILEKDYNASSEAETLLEEIGIVENDVVTNIPGNVEKMSRCKLVIDNDRVIELDLDDYINKRNITTETDMMGNKSITFTNIRDIEVK